MLAEIVEDPNFFAASETNLGFSIKAVFIEILSAPELRIFSMFSIDLIPPPTQSGIFKFFAVLFTNLSKLLVPYNEATESK